MFKVSKGKVLTFLKAMGEGWKKEHNKNFILFLFCFVTLIKY